jgi:hypothetical protein
MDVAVRPKQCSKRGRGIAMFGTQQTKALVSEGFIEPLLKSNKECRFRTPPAFRNPLLFDQLPEKLVAAIIRLLPRGFYAARCTLREFSYLPWLSTAAKSAPIVVVFEPALSNSKRYFVPRTNVDEGRAVLPIDKSKAMDAPIPLITLDAMQNFVLAAVKK